MQIIRDLWYGFNFHKLSSRTLEKLHDHLQLLSVRIQTEQLRRSEALAAAAAGRKRTRRVRAEDSDVLQVPLPSPASTQSAPDVGGDTSRAVHAINTRRALAATLPRSWSSLSLRSHGASSSLSRERSRAASPTSTFSQSLSSTPKSTTNAFNFTYSSPRGSLFGEAGLGEVPGRTRTIRSRSDSGIRAGSNGGGGAEVAGSASDEHGWVDEGMTGGVEPKNAASNGDAAGAVDPGRGGETTVTTSGDFEAGPQDASAADDGQSEIDPVSTDATLKDFKWKLKISSDSLFCAGY